VRAIVSTGPLVRRFFQDDRRFVLAAVVIAATIRLALVAIGTPIGWQDSRIYLEAGNELISGHLIQSHLVMPLYPLFLVLIGWDNVLYAQALLSAATVVLVYGLAREVFTERAPARWAALLMAVEPLTIFYANQRMSETLFIFLVCSALLLLYRQRILLGSIALVLSLLVRPSLDLVAPLLIVCFSFVFEKRPRPTAVARRLGIYALVYLVLLAPWWLHNYAKYDRFVRLNLGFGIVLRMEHNPIFVEHGFWQQLGFVNGEFAEVTDPVARDAKRAEAAIAFIKEDPVRYLELTIRRFGRFWSPVIDQSEDIPFVRRARYGIVIITLLIHAGALICLLQCGPSRLRRLAPLLLIIVYLTLLHTATNALVRYRVPLSPLLVVLAAAGWHGLMTDLSRRNGEKISRAAVK